MEYFQLLIEQIIIFMIYAGIGVIAVKAGVLQQHHLDVLARMVIKITLPIMLFHNVITGINVQEFISTISIIGLSIFMYITLYLLSIFLRKLFKKQGEYGNLYQGNVIFGNVGFMGIPVLTSLFPEYGILYSVMFMLVDQIVLWTMGINLTFPVHENHKNQKENFQNVLKKLLNPATVAIVLSLAGVFLGLQLPKELDVAFSKMGAITSPLAMFYIGALLSYTSIQDSIRHIEFYGTVLVKMILYPVAFFVFMGLFDGLNPEIRLTMTVLSAMPSMTSLAMLANSNGTDGSYCAGGIFVTTLCSVVTLPLVSYLTTIIG